jgi:hypothetical protein
MALKKTMLALAAALLALAVAAAAREHSLGPIWTLGWLPAVLAGVTASSRSPRCRLRLRRR